MTDITLNLTVEELKQIDKYVELNDETRPLFDKIKNAYPKPEKLLDVIRNLGYSYDCCYEIVDAVEEFQKPKEPEKWDVVRESKKWCEEHPNENPLDWVKPQTPKPMNEVLDRLENKYENDDVVNRMLKEWEENPPDFLKFELGKTLEALITRWWDDVYDGIHQDWDREVAIDDLIDQIQLWLPKEQDSSGTQSASVIDLVDGYNDALTKIKSKLRNKK